MFIGENRDFHSAGFLTGQHRPITQASTLLITTHTCTAHRHSSNFWRQWSWTYPCPHGARQRAPISFYALSKTHPQISVFIRGGFAIRRETLFGASPTDHPNAERWQRLAIALRPLPPTTPFVF